MADDDNDGLHFKAQYLGTVGKAYHLLFEGEDAARYVPRSERVVLDITEGKLTEGEDIDLFLAPWFCEAEGLS